MATSPLLKIPHIIQAQNQKEVMVNQGFDILESATAGVSAFNAEGSGSIALGDAAARPMVIEFTGVLTAGKTVLVPQRSKFYIFKNSTTGAFTLSVDTGIGTPMLLPTGFFLAVFCDGTDCVELPRLLNDHARSITGAITLETYDKIVFVDTTSGSFAVTLPLVIPIGQRFLIVKTVAANTLTIGRNTNTINAVAADVTITVTQQAIEVLGHSATNWLAYRQTNA